MTDGPPSVTSRRRVAWRLLALLPLVPASGYARAPGVAVPAALCQEAIRSAEVAARLPKRLLGAIGIVESGRFEPSTGMTLPWPWTIDAEGQPSFFASKDEAIAAVRVLQARGVVSIDVGCMQVNLMHHPQAFASLDEAFDPTLNARYAARFLVQLHRQTHDWSNAAALYHSATRDLAEAYQRRVMAVWGVPLPAPPPPAAAEAAAPALAGRVAVLLPPLRAENIRIIALDASPASDARVRR